MTVYPAIDLSGGRVVRLTQGDFARMDVYGDDPLAVAASFKGAGATRLHVVDLDGARDGAPRNAGVIRALAETSGLLVQTGGGIRTPGRVRALLEAGVARVILGTAALRDPDFLAAMLREHGERVAVGVDAKDGRVAVAGWLDVSDTDSMAFCARLGDMGVATVIYTDIARDGAFTGPNLAAYRRLVALGGPSVIASGGVGGEADIRALMETGVAGVITGKALYEKRLDLRRALAIAAGKETE